MTSARYGRGDERAGAGAADFQLAGEGRDPLPHARQADADDVAALTVEDMFGHAPAIILYFQGEAGLGPSQADDGVAGMKVGGKRTLLIPADLGYGSNGAGGVIPPGALLVFDVELLDVKPHE